jgi:hypothetical protein
MLASGHFGNNQAGQLKVLVILTSTDVVDKQEPVTPLRPDEYSTPVKEERKRKVKQEDTSPALSREKRIKKEDPVKKEGSAGDTGQIQQEVHIMMKPEELIPTTFCQSLTDDELESIADEIVVREDVVDLCEMGDSLRDQMLDSVLGPRGSEDMVNDGDEAIEKDGEQAVVPEFVRDQIISFPRQFLTLIGNSGVPS